MGLSAFMRDEYVPTARSQANGSFISRPRDVRSKRGVRDPGNTVVDMKSVARKRRTDHRKAVPHQQASALTVTRAPIDELTRPAD